ncbi:MAG TPA: YceH family protein [Blastocatellia bacterium]|nr:YceH family protein [Blastocatellia bacterium]
MNPVLSAEEIRVLGSLIEKQITTPDYYPMTLNALTNACNQLSNREPVVAYDEQTVAQAFESLSRKQIVWTIKRGDSRVVKHGHLFAEAFDLNPQQVAVMCVLMLRGPQTAGEIRGRTGRLYNFADLDEVEATLQQLIDRENGPLVARLPRQAGRKEPRYAHLLSGEVSVEEEVMPSRPEPVAASVDDDRVARLEEEIAALRQELRELAQQFFDFKKQFE